MMLKLSRNVVGLCAVLSILGGCSSSEYTTYSLFQEYRDQPGNKAYAIGINKVAGAAWSAGSIQDAQAAALSTCKELGGVNCNIVDINDSAVGY
ncbi:hypothetical protein [Photobacterium sp. TY1-4]|uniref:hypothetical protein n=1 Tax=Photobacterium sp. TY1-4 TaxID=2899122 RepID=UPI0021BFB552|nr:hypothetical protein [Photobacterium sp. TY1-4]UXI01947.1 hypothetical protein NH461_03900 [Photobacterium sp. TY1-4]